VTTYFDSDEDDFARMHQIWLASRELGSAAYSVWIDNPRTRPWIAAAALLACAVLAKGFDDRRA
jgi:hypothetical protein